MDNAKQERQPAFQTLFERLEKSIIINKDLIESCQNKSQRLCGAVPSELDESIKEDTSDSDQTIIEMLHSYCTLIERNNSALRQVNQELNNAI